MLSGGEGGGQGVLWYFQIYVSLAHILGFKILNFNIYFNIYLFFGGGGGGAGFRKMNILGHCK